MIRMRFVTMFSLFVVFLASYAAYEHRAPAFTGATDPAHVSAAKAMLKTLPTPAGMTLDPYGTGCNITGLYCFTSSSVEPEAASAATTAALVAHGGRVRSHVCGGRDLVEHACQVIVDYHGSRIDVMAGPNLLRPGNARTHLLLSLSGADQRQPASASAPYGSWKSVDPLPAGWTTGVTCTKPAATGCLVFDQQVLASPVIAVTAAEACSTVRRVMEGRYNLAVNADRPATATHAGGCNLFGHRYRTVGGTDGELLYVSVVTKNASHVVMRVRLDATS
jgi:hypothetical protein